MQCVLEHCVRAVMLKSGDCGESGTVFENASLLSSAILKLYLFSRCSAELQKMNVVDISSHRNRRNGISLQRKIITIKKSSGSVKCRFH